MLTIQPKFTTGFTYRPTFRSSENDYLTEENYNEEKEFIEKQIDGFDEIINDDYVPEKMKKGIKVLKILSEGILEGWAIAWGTKKGMNFLRNTGAKAVKSKTYAEVKDMLKPAKDGFTKIGKNINEFASEKIQKLGDAKLVKDLKNSTNGRYIIEKAKQINSYFGNLKEAAKEKLGNLTFDKFTNITAATFGIGSGTTGIINSALETKDEEYTENEAA